MEFVSDYGAEVGQDKDDILAELERLSRQRLGRTGRITQTGDVKVRIGQKRTSATKYVEFPKVMMDANGIKRHYREETDEATGFIRKVFAPPTHRDKRDIGVESEINYSQDVDVASDPAWIVATFVDNMAEVYAIL